MKNATIRGFYLSMISILVCLSLSSCEPSYWEPGPPNGWEDNYFYDSRLDGYWQLVLTNNTTVSGTSANYLFFNGCGRGLYYYYFDGHRYTETTAYWCQRSGNGSGYQINLKYQNSTPTTMRYWFEGPDNLYMQWRDQSGLQTYLYKSYPGAPWVH